jgi:hypothetical protein
LPDIRWFDCEVLHPEITGPHFSAVSIEGKIYHASLACGRPASIAPAPDRKPKTKP